MNKNITKKLDEIMDKELPFENDEPYDYDWGEFESDYDVIIPDDYKDFVVINKYEYTKDDYYFETIEKSSKTPPDGLEFIDSFYSLQDFFENVDEFIELWCDYVLPIGEVAGDYICIGVKESNLGKVYMLNHDDEEREDGLYLIANSFNDFIMSFKYVEQE